MPAKKLATLTFGIVIAPIVTTPLSTSGLGNAISVGSPASRVVSSVAVLQDLADRERAEQHGDVRARRGAVGTRPAPSAVPR